MSSRTWGGRREGAGRKAEDGATDLVKITVSVTQGMAEWIDKKGEGNMSLGARKILGEAMYAAKVYDRPKKKVGITIISNETVMGVTTARRRIVQPYPTRDNQPSIPGILKLQRLQQEWREKYPDLSSDDY
jgi:hypothetical protein